MPTPPTPVMVTIGECSRAVATLASSASRPTNDVGRSGQVAGEGVEGPEGREVRAQAVGVDLEHVLGPGEVAELVVAEVAPAQVGRAAPSRASSSVAREHTIWPPCAIAEMRAARFTAVP